MAEKQQAVTEFYNNTSPRGAWEFLLGDHLHEGFYDPGTTATISGSQAAAARMIDEALRFANIYDDPSKKPKNMLDIGCGVGGTCVHVAKQYGIQCKGITLSPEEVKCAQGIAKAQGLEEKVSFDVGDALNLPYKDGTFDLVLTIECIEHVQDKEKFIREMIRVAAPGAPIVILSYAHRNLSPSAESLKPDEKKVLKKICDNLALSCLCSSADFVRWLTQLPAEDIKTADWTQNTSPFFPLLMKETFTWKGFTSLLMKGGWTAIKELLALRMMSKAADDGLLKFVAITCRKSK
uniref:Norajmaline N-methyltransferase n=1 Tax=Rauvolfia serpentina TaxID=4060 RepID=NNMT_RAUSE|nr:tocopherol-like methyltransferase [Rauvolfia serpentina]